MARVTSIQTGAERAAGQPGQLHDEDLHEREARTRQAIAETRAGIERCRANVEHLNRTGRFPN